MADFFSEQQHDAVAQSDQGSDLFAAPQPAAAPKRGHGPQPSVGNAATLFGGSGDDPFASILSPTTPTRPTMSLGSLQEEDAPEPEQPAGAAASLFGGGSRGESASAGDDLFGGGPNVGAAPAADTSFLGVPSLNTPASAGSSGPPSPSKLFTSTSSYGDDWLGGGSAAGAAVPTEAIAAEPATQSYDYQAHGYDSHSGYDQQQYDQQAYDQQQYGEYSQANGYGDQTHQNYDEAGYHSHQGYGAQQQQQVDDQAQQQQQYGEQQYGEQQYGEQQYGYEYPQQEQQHQQQYDGQYDYSSQQQYEEQSSGGQHAQQYDQQGSQYGQHSQQYDQQSYQPYDQPQYQYDQQPSSAYDTSQSSFGQDYSQQGQDQSYNAAYGAFDSSQYGQAAQPSQDSAYAPQQGAAYSSHDSAARGYSYDAGNSNHSYGQPAPAEETQWSSQSYDAQDPQGAQLAPDGGYGSYEQTADVAQQHDQYGQAYAGHEYGQSHAATAAAPRAPSPYDPVPAPPTADATRDRAPSPYDPVPASPHLATSLLSPTQSQSSPRLSPSGLPPPPPGPPRGPPRGPAKTASIARPDSTNLSDPHTSQQVAVTEPSVSDAYSWDSNVAHPAAATLSSASSEHASASNDWDEGGDDESGQKQSGWVHELEDAAATPPPQEEALVPPKLTVTDEDATGSLVYDPEDAVRHTELAAASTEGSDDPLEPQDVQTIDHAVEALQDLNLHGQEDVDVKLEQSVETQLHADAPVDGSGYDAPTDQFGSQEEAGLSVEGGEASRGNQYGYEYQSYGDDAQSQAANSHAETGWGFDEEQISEEAMADPYGAPSTGPGGQPYSSHSGDVSEDPYAPPSGSAGPGGQPYSSHSRDVSEDPYAPLSGRAPGTGSGTGNAQSQWPEQGTYDYGESNVESTGDEQQNYGYAPHSSSQYDPYAPASGSSSTKDPASSQATPSDAATPAYGAYEPYSDHTTHLQSSYDDSNVRTPSAATQETAWPGMSGSGEDPYAANGASDVGLKRASTVTQRSIRAAASESAVDGGYRPYGQQSSSEDSPYRPGTTDPTSERRPETPSRQSSAANGNYFDHGAMYGSPSQALGYGGATAAPTSPYEPTRAAPSYASEMSYPSSVSGSGIDMQEQMRNAKIPIVSFGFGGQLVTYFPTFSGPTDESAAEGAYGGFGYSGSNGAPTKVTLRALSSQIPSSSYATAFDPLQFPGPAFEGASANALSRATGGANAGAKAKKAALIKHLDEKIEEVSAGVGYLRRRPSLSAIGPGADDASAAAGAASSKLDCQRAEDKVALLKLLRLILLHDAQTTNNPAFDTAVRELLVGQQGSDKESAGSAFPGAGAVSTFGSVASSSSSSQVLRSYELKSDFLETMQAMLLRGERREAVRLAVEQKMWAHAMTIASCVDKDCWKTVVSEFIEDELGSGVGLVTGSAGQQGPDLQTLKVAYNVFSGQDPVSVFDLFRPRKQMLLDPSQPVDAIPSAQSSTLPDWRGSAAVVFSNKSANDSAALTAIGDGLAVHGLIEAAHFCYVLAPTTSPFGGVDLAAVRMTLLGCTSPKTSSSYLQDLDSIMLTEILEFAQSLAPVAKGQDAYAGIPHLQAFRLVHAYRLAELGEVQRAQKYCEAIAGALKLSKNSPYLHRTLLSQLKELSDRLVGAPQTGGAGNWMTRKMQRPTLDGVWGALEGRFTKFIAGEENDQAGSPARSKSQGAGGAGNGGPIGPFSHYTAITPDAAAGGMSRQQSYADLNGPPSVPHSRAGSAMDFHHSRRAASPKHRASSAMGVRQSPRDPYNAWPQPLSQLTSGDNGAPSSGGHSFEASRNGHVVQTSEYSGYAGRDSFQSSRFSEDRGGGSGWPGSEAATDSRRPSVDTYDQSSENNNYGGSANDGRGYPGYSAYDDEHGRGDEYGGAKGDVPYYGYQPHGAEQPQFISNVDGPSLESAEDGGFVSPMDALSGNAGRDARTPQPQSNYSQDRYNAYDEEDEEDDLGLGNASSKKKQPASAHDDRGAASSYEPAAAAKEEDKEEEQKDKEEDKPGLKPSASSSWLGRFWSRSSSASSAAEQAKAKKAHLGEETAFYYDKDLKRWVNKKAGDSAAPASPPPPPPRAATTSPAVGPDRGAGTASAPPMRSAGQGPPPMGGAPPPLRSSSSLTGFSGRATPPISEEGSFGGGGVGGRPPMQGSNGLARARSNLADHTMPPAAQPARSGSATPLGAGPPGSSGNAMSPPPPPPPGGSRTGTVKKRPIKSRYVVVD